MIELIDLTLSDTEQTPDEHQGQDDSPPIGAAIRSHSKRVLGDGIHLNPPIVQLPKLAQPIIPIRPQNLTQHVPNHHSNPFVILAPKQISSSEQLRNQQYQWTLASRQKPKPRSLVEPMNWSGRSSREQISCLGQAPPIEVRVRSDDGQQITQIMRYGALGKRRQVISGGIQRSGHGWVCLLLNRTSGNMFVFRPISDVISMTVKFERSSRRIQMYTHQFSLPVILHSSLLIIWNQTITRIMKKL